jgi:uncharacterized membrane protein YbhN (UPF0104 family)
MMVALQAFTKRHSSLLKLLLKITITACCFWYISYKIDIGKAGEVLPYTNGWWLSGAVIAFIVSKMFSSFRLNIYFRHIGLSLSEKKNLQLYWLGMFYNLFLPGSISGDAYKVVRLTKEYGLSYKKTTAAVLLDRLSGLLALGLLLAVFWVALFRMGFYSRAVIVAAFLSVPAFYFAIRIFFPYLLRAFWSTLFWGLAVQVFQVVTMFCLLNALHINAGIYEYLLIFLVSSVVAVLPFTIGGLGAREMVFLWGAALFHLDNTVSVMASGLFYITTVLSSSLGLPYIFYDPLKNRKD